MISDQKTTLEIKSLTGLRGIAALYVVFHHLLAGRDGTGELVQKLVLKGYLAVDLFFVLSGLVMALTYRSMFIRHYSMSDHADFLARRAARIVPLYICVLFLALGLHAEQGQPIGYSTLAANIFLMQSWGIGIDPVVPPSWSISTEMVAYLVFPVLCIPTLRSARLGPFTSLCVSLACVGASTVLVSLYQKSRMYGALDVWDGTTVAPLLRCIGGFTLGLLVFRSASSVALRRVVQSDLFGGAALGLLLAGILTGVNDLVLYPLLPALVACLYVNQGRLSRALSSPPVHRLGVLSYAIYLIHSLLIEVLWPASQAWMSGYPTPVRGIVSTTLCLVCIMILAHLLHVSVEKPGRSWVRRLAQTKTDRLGATLTRS